MNPSPSVALLPPKMERILDPSGVTFNAAAGTLKFTTTVPLSLAHILRVVNLTRGEFYFDSTGNNGQGLTQSATYASPVLTLNHRLDDAANTDTLAVLYDDGSAGGGGGGGGGGDASAANQTLQLTELQGINSKTPAPRTPTTTSVASSATSVTLLASNANRRGVTIANDSTAVLRVSFSTPATAANAFVVIPAGGFLVITQQLLVTSAIYGIWASANGTAQVTEYV